MGREAEWRKLMSMGSWLVGSNIFYFPTIKKNDEYLSNGCHPAGTMIYSGVALTS